MSNSEEDCHEPICIEDDPTGNYKNYAKQRQKKMRNLYGNDDKNQGKDDFSPEFDDFSLTKPEEKMDKGVKIYH